MYIIPEYVKPGIWHITLLKKRLSELYEEHGGLPIKIIRSRLSYLH